MPDRVAKLEAVAQLAAEGWEQWERDHFESYLDALKTDAEEALRDGQEGS